MSNAWVNASKEGPPAAASAEAIPVKSTCGFDALDEVGPAKAVRTSGGTNADRNSILKPPKPEFP